MKICVSLDEFIRISVEWIYCLAPGHKPRFINEITDGIITNFKINCKTIGDFFYHEIELKDLYKFIENILMPIDKFRELNLSQNEYERGVKVDDEDRPKFHFISAFSTVQDKDNFVDLDACIQDIFSSYEHRYFYHWAYGEMDIDKLTQFRQEYRNLGETE